MPGLLGAFGKKIHYGYIYLRLGRFEIEN